MLNHIKAWFEFAQRLNLVERMEDIILVTGRHLTKSWINVAFHPGCPNASVSFNTYLSDDRDVRIETNYVHGAELKLGPIGRVRFPISRALNVFRDISDMTLRVLEST